MARTRAARFKKYDGGDPLAAPVDLLPKTTVVTLALPTGVDPATVTARVSLPEDAAEVTQRNNHVPLRP